MFYQFLRLVLPRFFGASGEYAFEFLTACEDRLRGIGLINTNGVDYNIFQLDLSAHH